MVHQTNEMINPTIYTITVIDLYTDKVLGLRRTPAIFTDLNKAIYTVRNNIDNLSDGIIYQYAVIEESELNVVRPNLEKQGLRLWFKYNSAVDEFEQSSPPPQLRMQSGFGIG